MENAPAGFLCACGSCALVQSHPRGLLFLSTIDFSILSVYSLAYCAAIPYALFMNQTHLRFMSTLSHHRRMEQLH